MMRRKEMVLLIVLILLTTGAWVFSQDNIVSEKQKHEIGVGTILPAGPAGSNFLNFSYKYHFEKGAIRTAQFLGVENSARSDDPNYYIRRGQTIWTFLGYELFRDFGRFRFSYGGDLGYFWERNASGYGVKPNKISDSEVDISWSFGLRPFLGIGFRIVPGLSVSFESQALFAFGLPDGFENVGEDSYYYDMGMIPLGLLSFNYHF